MTKTKKGFRKINRIKDILNDIEMSQAEFARKFKRTTNLVSLYCSNQTQPRVQDFPEIAKILNVPIRKLLHTK